MMKKTLLTKTASIILALLMVVSTLVIVPFSVSAEGTVLTIGTPEKLVAFKESLASETYEGQIVKLTANIDMTGVAWTPAADTFKGTFDGDGYSIQNLSATTAAGAGVLFGTLENATVQNLSIVGGTITATVAGSGTLAGSTLGNLTTIQNVYINNTVNSSANNCGVMFGRNYATQTEILNCVVDSVLTITACNSKHYGYSGFIGRLGSGNIKMENCAFFGSVINTSSVTPNMGAFVGQASETQGASTVDFINCYNMGTTAFSWAETNTPSNWGALNDESTPPVTVNSDNFAATLGALVEAGAAWTQTAENEMMPTTVATMLGITYVPEGPGEEPEEPVADVIIKTPQELQDFINTTADNTYEGKTIVLANDLDMTNHSWVSLGWAQGKDGIFMGTFDGQGHSIKNLSSAKTVYLFRGLDDKATVQNLSIVESTITAGNNEGVLALWARNGAHIKNVYINVTVKSGSSFVGGMIGQAAGAFTVENCVVASTMKAESANTTFGGFLGQPAGSNDQIVTFKNCAFLGSIEVGNGCSGFVSLFGAQVGRAETINCVNLGDMDYNNWAATWESDYGVKAVNNSKTFADILKELKDAGADWTQTGKTEMMPTSVAEMIGKDYFETDLYYQRATSLNADGTVDVRFITVIDTLDYDQVGFKLQITRTDANKVTTTSNVVTKATTQVFESINALGETVTAEELGGKYIVAVVITGINCADYENVISVTAFVQNGETQTPTATGTVTLATTAVAA